MFRKEVFLGFGQASAGLFLPNVVLTLRSVPGMVQGASVRPLGSPG